MTFSRSHAPRLIRPIATGGLSFRAAASFQDISMKPAGPSQSPNGSIYRCHQILLSQVFAWLWLLVLAFRERMPVAAAAAAAEVKSQEGRQDTQECATRVYSSTSLDPVAFIVLQSPDWSALQKLLAAHEREQHAVLQSLSRSLEVALQTEADLQLDHRAGELLSASIQRRIDTLSTLFENDLRLLRVILRPFDTVQALPWAPTIPTRTRQGETSRLTSESLSTQIAYYSSLFRNVSDGSHSYDAVVQVVAHLVRDWSAGGAAAPIRASLYDWCRHRVRELQHRLEAGALRILVPGAGLGRLAYDLAREGHAVHAVELSLAMAAAAAFMFQSPKGRNETLFGDERRSNNTFLLHPFTMDALSNEVESQLRYQPVTLARPDPSLLPPGASLSYTVSDFTDLPLHETSDDVGGAFNAVVTCFFLDTATNVYTYLRQIHAALAPGGAWINVGPVQWHRNAELFPSANELRVMIQAVGFTISSWAVDAEPLEYRSGEEAARSTHFDAFCPLRFVAVKQK